MARTLGQLAIAVCAVVAASYFAVITPTVAGTPDEPFAQSADDSSATISEPESAQASAPRQQRITPPMLPGDAGATRRFPPRQTDHFVRRTAHEVAAPNVAAQSSTASTPTNNVHADVAASPAAAISLTWELPTSVTSDQALEGALVVHNRGAGQAHEVVVQAEFPTGLTLNASQPQAESEGSIVTWQLGQLDAGTTRRITLQMTAQGEGSLTPAATVRSTVAASAEIALSRPQLELTAEAAPNWQLGHSAALAFTVTNRGEAANGVAIVVQLPEGLQHAEGSEVRYALGALGAGESRPVEILCTPTAAGEYQVTGNALVGTAAVAEAVCHLAVERPVLELAAAGPKVRYVGRRASYTLQVQNPGTAATSNVRVALDVPAGLRFVSANAGGGYDATSRQATWFLGRLEPGANTEVELTLIAEQPGAQPLVAWATADGGAEASIEGTMQVEGLAALEIELIWQDDAIEIDAETVAEVRLTNRGSKVAKAVEIALRLGDELTAQGAAGPTEATCDGGDVVFAPLEELQPGESTSFSVKVHGATAGKSRATAFARSEDQPDVLQAEGLITVYED